VAVEAELEIDAADAGLDGVCAAEAGIVSDEETVDASEGVGDVDLERECLPLEYCESLVYWECWTFKACIMRCKFNMRMDYK
jgi:hypothetical protein